jgi:hypothetical protein
MADDADDQRAAAGMMSAESASKLLMITRQRIAQLVREGFIPAPASRGAYHVVGTVQGYIRFLKDEERRTSKTQAESKVRDARAREIEIRIAEKTRDLVPMDEAMNAVDYVFGLLKTELVSMPARITRDLALRRQIEDELDGTLARATGRVAQAGLALRAGRDPDAADAEDEPGHMGREEQNLSG